jgi:glycosyltransferase involved in cell wall biosynthesis
MNGPKITVIINNYNYGQFLKMSIDSVLEQTYPAHEIILVDDGSTDNSREVAESYGNRIQFVPKANGGQASTFNTGYQVSTGDWIWFLDSDDMLTPDALEEVAALTHLNASKIHGKLIMTDINGELLGKIAPTLPLSDGNVVSELEENGLYIWPPTSGNVFPRTLLESCMPIPEDKFRLCVDLYLCNHAAIHGDIVSTKKPVGYYRIHGSNNFSGYKLESKRLKNQALNIIATVDLLNDLFKTRKGFKFPYSRWNFETLLLAKRFSDYKDLDHFSYNDLYVKWKQTPQVMQEGSLMQIALKLYWRMMRYLPRTMIEKLLS